MDPRAALSMLARPTPAPGTARGTLVIAGATGVLGAAVLHRLVGMQRHAHTHVLALTAMTDGLRGVSALVLPEGSAAPWQAAGRGAPAVAQGGADVARWPLAPADSAVVLFDPPRLFHGRERALFTPTPELLPDLARWLRRCGVRTLAVVQPHAPASLPQSLQRGLASLDEQAVAAAGFERLLIVRSPVKPGAAPAAATLPRRVAAWMLSTLRYMVPGSEQPVRAVRVAAFVDQALQLLPQGTWVAPPELVWRASQGDASQLRALVQAWVQGAPVGDAQADRARAPADASAAPAPGRP